MGDGTFSQEQVGAGFNKITLSKKSHILSNDLYHFCNLFIEFFCRLY